MAVLAGMMLWVRVLAAERGAGLMVRPGQLWMAARAHLLRAARVVRERSEQEAAVVWVLGAAGITVIMAAAAAAAITGQAERIPAALVAAHRWQRR